VAAIQPLGVAPRNRVGHEQPAAPLKRNVFHLCEQPRFEPLAARRRMDP
jgi:hypothetical protein